MSLLVFTGVFLIPHALRQARDCAVRVNPRTYIEPHWPITSYHAINPVTAYVACREHWLRAASCQHIMLPWDGSSI